MLRDFLVRILFLNDRDAHEPWYIHAMQVTQTLILYIVLLFMALSFILYVCGLFHPTF